VDLDSIRNITLDDIRDFFADEKMRMYVILGGTAVIAVLCLVLVIIPRVTVLSRISAEAKALSDRISVTTDRVKSIDRLSKKLEGLREELNGYSRGLPDQKEITEFLEDLSAIAKTSDVKILSITPSGLEAAEKGKSEKVYYREMPIMITAKSGYHQLGRFVSNLEKGERFVTIEDLEIRYNKATPRKHTVEMGLKTYVSVEDEAEK